ncbi:phytoene desaturase family protein [Streptomyces millisiae]|uniref:NAD(P)/FAD-dependent oxidoreductase n=1 Tax=Streptomyces millisiae TaxID=3075542 RepID=A0ABU2M2B8_9ACTN|nr:NAD(P)/FAD-dependent oxidoreductase [Streptomyces sp. DSM 44918]MDT0323688.1 NAD(P)/FAD-dependent oxidoreductase [Streptomyces sp. DSM 44918]
MARIVVVGAGMGAMAAAARLATAGHRVTVVERTSTHGGAVGRFARDGFAFDTGPGLLHLPAVWRDLFIKTGKRELGECVELNRVDPAVEHRFADGVAVRLPAALGGAQQALDDAFGAGAGERWAALLRRARQVWESTRRPLVEEPLTTPEQRAALREDPYPHAARRGLLRRRAPGTLAELATAELREPRLAALLTGTVWEYGVDPAVAPPGAAVLAYVERSFGSWYPAGGMRALADAVYERCLERRVEFVFGTAAERILAREGRAGGVELADGATVPADSVVWGAPGLGATAPHATGRLTVLLALRGPRPAGTPHRTLVHRADLGRPPVRVLRPDDPALRPDADHETAVLSAPAPAHGVGGVDWPAPGAADRAADELLAAAEAAGLDLGGRVLWRETRTPADVERDTGMPGGVLPTPALAGADATFLAGANTGRLAGAYRVGALAHPGGGLAHAGMSGALATGLIVEGPSWRGSY